MDETGRRLTEEEQREIRKGLARSLFDELERLDPGAELANWEDASPIERRLYFDLVEYLLVGRRGELLRALAYDGEVGWGTDES